MLRARQQGRAERGGYHRRTAPHSPKETCFTELAMTILELGEAISNSLSYSSILILTALGLAITFGVMRVINMAHGEMLMLGAYTAFVVENPQAVPVMVRNFGKLFGAQWQTDFGFHLNLFVAIPAAFLFVGFVGYLL